MEEANRVKLQLDTIDDVVRIVHKFEEGKIEKEGLQKELLDVDKSYAVLGISLPERAEPSSESLIKLLEPLLSFLHQNLKINQDDPNLIRYYLCKSNLCYELWKLNVTVTNSLTAVKFAKDFLGSSKYIELNCVKTINQGSEALKKLGSSDPSRCKQYNEAILSNKAYLVDCYFLQTEVGLWLSQYYANDLDQCNAYLCRARLRLLLIQKVNALGGTQENSFTLDDIRKSKLEKFAENATLAGLFIQSRISEIEIIDLFRTEFLGDIQSLRDKVIEDFKSEDYTQIELSQTLDCFADIYTKAQLVAVIPHKGMNASLNKRYYENTGVKKLDKLFREMDEAQRATLRNQGLFDLSASLQAQENTFGKIIEIVDDLKQRFGMKTRDIELLNGDDEKILKNTLKENLELDFKSRLERARIYSRMIEQNRQALDQILENAGRDIHRHYYSQFYNYFERLFLACKDISSGLINHTHQQALGKVGSFMGIIAGPLGQIPIVGSAVSAVVQVAGAAAVQADYKRVMNRLRAFDQAFASEALKYLASYLARELVNAHYHQLPKIYGVAETPVANARQWALNEGKPNVFSRVSEYFCSCIFAILMESNSLSEKLQSANHTVMFNGDEVSFIQSIGSLMLDELFHYRKTGIIAEINNFFSKSGLIKYKDITQEQSLHHIFGVASVLTETTEIYNHMKHTDACAVAQFGFIQSSSRRAVARTTSLEKITRSGALPAVPSWQTFNPVFAPTEVSFPSMHAQLQRQDELIKRQELEITQLKERLSNLEKQLSNLGHDNNVARQAK